LSIEGTVFEQTVDSGVLERVLQDPLTDPQFRDAVEHFCRATALCNTVIPSFDEEHDGKRTAMTCIRSLLDSIEPLMLLTA
jgi:hypothetical protein